MRLLIFTQKIDKNDPVLGFFHEWVVKISQKCESVQVICIESGEYSFDASVKVHTRGKGFGFGRLKYIYDVYHYLFLLRGKYDKVFIHMNQEYVFSLGPYWKFKGIPVYLWRNHPEGSFLTSIAVMLSTKVFCTAPNSFTSSFGKTILMPVGYDNNIIKPVDGAIRKKYSILMLGRISPVKNIDLGIEAVSHLIKSGTRVSFSIVGSPPKRDVVYYEDLKKNVMNLGLSNNLIFKEEVVKTKTPEIFSSHEIFLNLTNSFDKTIVESVACGAIPLVSNASLSSLLPEVCITKTSPEEIANSLKVLLNPSEQIKIKKDLEKFVESQSLDSLISKLFNEIN